MQRRNFILATGATMAAAVAGCIGDEDNADDENNPTNNNNSSNSDVTRTVSVSGAATIEAEPDIARFVVSVEETGDEPGDVQESVASEIDALHTELVDEGIAEDDIITGEFQIRERVDEEQMMEDGVEPRDEEDFEPYVYYVGTHELEIETDDPENVGEYIDVAVAAGADNIGDISFDLSEERRDELEEEALREALENAETEATVIVEETETEIVDVKTVDASSPSVSPVRASLEAYDMDVDDSPDTEIHEDDVTIATSVDVVYLIE